VTLWRQQPEPDWGYNIFLDTLSARRMTAEEFEVWVIADFDTALVDRRGPPYISAAQSYRIDCARDRMEPLVFITLDSTKSRVTRREVHPDRSAAAVDDYRVPPKGTEAYATWRSACATLQHEPWQWEID
jgi:hypothetical protein